MAPTETDSKHSALTTTTGTPSAAAIELQRNHKLTTAADPVSDAVSAVALPSLDQHHVSAKQQRPAPSGTGPPPLEPGRESGTEQECDHAHEHHHEHDQDQDGQQLTNVAHLEDVPPNGGYGWVCTACVLLMNANTWGCNAAWAIFLAHYLSHSTFPGATQLQYALIGGLSISQAMMVSPVVAASNRHLGTRATLLLGSALVSAAWLSASFATQVWHLFLTVGMAFGWGMGMVYITASAILPQWFSTRRSLAVGLAASGAGIGGLFYNLLAGFLVQSLSVPWTYRVISILTFFINGVSSILLKDRNRFVKPVQSSFSYRELGHAEVLLLICWGFVTDIGYVVLLFSLPHYASDSLGLSQTQGSIVGAMLNLGMAIGRPLIGYYSDAWGRINMAGMMTALCGILCLALWVPANSFAMLLVFAIPAGAVAGIYWGTVIAVTAEVVGLKRLPPVFGIICVALVAPTTFAEPMALEIVSASGYLTSQVFVGFLYLLGAAFVLLLRSWKIAEMRAKAEVERECDGPPITTRAVIRAFQWLSPRSVFVLQRV